MMHPVAEMAEAALFSPYEKHHNNIYIKQAIQQIKNYSQEHPSSKSLAKRYIQRLNDQIRTNRYILDLIRKDKPGFSPQWCVKTNDLKAIKYFIRCDETGEINKPDERKRTALHLAAANDQLDFVQAILNSPFVDKELKTVKGNKAIDVAADEKIRSLLR